MRKTNKRRFLAYAILALTVAIAVSACGEQASPPEPVEEEVENVEMTLTLEDWTDDGTGKEEYERTGTYTGTVVDGIPNGKGKFDTQNSEGITWHYEGDFKDGKFNGHGKQTWDNEDVQTIEGTYMDGCFTPDTAEFFASTIPSMTNDFTMSDKSISYIKSHPDFFPAKDAETLEKVKENMDTSIEYKHLQKNVANYLETFVTEQNLYVAQVEEGVMYGNEYTFLLVGSESDGTYRELWYPGKCDLFQGDYASYIGLPVGFATFDNTNGDKSWASIIVVSDLW